MKNYQPHYLSEGVLSNIKDKLTKTITDIKSKISPSDEQALKTKAKEITQNFMTATQQAKVEPTVGNLVGWLTKFKSLSKDDIITGFRTINMDVTSLLNPARTNNEDPIVSAQPEAKDISTDEPDNTQDVSGVSIKDINGRDMYVGSTVTILVSQNNSAMSMADRKAVPGTVKSIDPVSGSVVVSRSKKNLIRYSQKMIGAGYVMVGELSKQGMLAAIKTHKAKVVTAGFNPGKQAILEAKFRYGARSNMVGLIESLSNVVHTMLLTEASVAATVLPTNVLDVLFEILLYIQRAKQHGFDITTIQLPEVSDDYIKHHVDTVINDINWNAAPSATKNEVIKETITLNHAPEWVKSEVSPYVHKIIAMDDGAMNALCIAGIAHIEQMLKLKNDKLLKKFIKVFFDYITLDSERIIASHVKA